MSARNVRSARHAIERRADGTTLLTSRRPLGDCEPLDPGRARERGPPRTPTGRWPPQRGRDDRWVTLSYGEARARRTRSRQALLDLGLGPERPLMILSGNSIEHLLLSLGAYTARRPGDADQRRLLADERRPRTDPGDRRTDQARARLRRRRGAVLGRARRLGSRCCPCADRHAVSAPGAERLGDLVDARRATRSTRRSTRSARTPSPSCCSPRARPACPRE